MPGSATSQPVSQPELTVAAGAIVALRLFDVAYAIDLARAETLLAEQARTAHRSRLSATPPKAMVFGVRARCGRRSIRSSWCWTVRKWRLPRRRGFMTSGQ